MRKSSFVVAVLIAMAGFALLLAQSTVPQMQSVDPGSAKAGDVVTVTGENLDQSIVAALYLTNGKEDFRAEITEQTATSIKFKIPSVVKTGRLALMVLTKGKEPRLIEEPVKVLIESPMAPPTGY
ncbi:MAG TPA: IPT/TIG domain-containing protein [Bryobacteraceae bacterium]|jgi:hypothetical protein